MDMEKGTITRRMDEVLNGLESEFRALYERSDFDCAINALKRAGTRSDRPSKLQRLFHMFDQCGISYEKGRDNDYYEKLVAEASLPDFSEIETRIVYALYRRYKEYPAPEDYMLRIVDRMEHGEDHWSEAPLRVRILRQFIRYGGCLSDAGYGSRKLISDYVKEKLGRKPSEEEMADQVDDGVFDGLAGATKAQKKPEGKYGLLKLADDLASGKFRVQGATKRGLYLFAMVYGMTYYSGDGANGEILDYRSDIETNLFQDYYSNNLMRFISDAYKGRLFEYELDPSGQGINYKNFAEMIYLYYISRDLSPRDKIRRSSKMIGKVQELRYKKGGPDDGRKRGTVFYRALIRDRDMNAVCSEDILGLPEKEFMEFLCENYNCDTFAETYETKNGPMDRRMGDLQMETEQKTAYDVYRKLIEELESEFAKSRKLLKDNFSLENCNYGLWFTDVAAFKKKNCEDICSRMPDVDRESFEEFMDLLAGVNSFMGYTASEEESQMNEQQERGALSKMKTKALYVDSPANITRTSLIVAFYYYFNFVHEDDEGQWKSFEELFNYFKRNVDELLVSAFYQPLSGKNIFDVLVVFSSYAYLNM